MKKLWEAWEMDEFLSSLICIGISGGQNWQMKLHLLGKQR